MTFAHPLYLWLAGAAALVVVGLHYLTTMQQRPSVFPTTRFIPEQQLRYRTVSRRFSDLWLMLLRILALLLLGLALAQPRFTVARSPVVRIALIDVSSSVLRDSSWRAEVIRIIEGATTVVAFDSVARTVGGGEVERLEAAAPGRFRQVGRLSPALVEALRNAQRLRDRADSIELIVLAPFVTGATDEATLAIRATWPGAIRLVRAPLADWPTTGAAVLEWADSTASPRWQPRLRPDTMLGVHTGDATLIARFLRRWNLRAGDSAYVIARWLDGAPAMVEQTTASGCLRSIGFTLPGEGDATFRPEFDRFDQLLRSPCRQALRPAALPAAVQQALAGDGGRIAAASLPAVPPLMLPMTPWLLLLVTLLVLGELWLRIPRGERTPRP